MHAAGPRASVPVCLPDVPAGEAAAARVSLNVVDHDRRLPERAVRPLQQIALALACSGMLLIESALLIRLGWAARLLLAALAIIGFLIGRWAVRRAFRRAADEADLQFEPMPLPFHPARLQAFGRNSELAPLRSLTRAPFEPLIFTRAIATPASFPRWTVELAVAAFVTAATIHSANLRWTGIALVPPFAVGLAWLRPRLRPTYYRIVPGQLDVLVASPFSQRVRLASRWDLRKSLVGVRFDRPELVVTSWAARRRLNLAQVSEPRKFVVAVFQAAVSPSATPDLPTDSLLG